MLKRTRNKRKNSMVRYGTNDRRLRSILDEIDFPQRGVLELCQLCSLSCKQKAIEGTIIDFKCTAYKA